ncbi:helix-turn-helix domain-containing protein [Acerihabitans sp. TG2]|uniref:helix-turn-helix domain-containing protein n=1 Tax=Acerihabitans sp. TG2 TaxID=3096008 RepID=UPI003A599492
MLERESISRGLACGMRYRALGRQLGRSALTVLREVSANGWLSPGHDERKNLD